MRAIEDSLTPPSSEAPAWPWGALFAQAACAALALVVVADLPNPPVALAGCFPISLCEAHPLTAGAIAAPANGGHPASRFGTRAGVSNGGRAVPRGLAPVQAAPAGVAPLASPPAGSNEVDERAPGGSRGADTAPRSLTLEESFVGIEDIGGKIPPDPILGAGPDHLVAAVNSRFAIFAKDGTELSELSLSGTDGWFDGVVTAATAGVFDPKVVYDHFANRWVIVVLGQSNQAEESWFYLSVSDTGDPTGSWCNFRIAGNASLLANVWADNEDLGFDEDALYIPSNQYPFGQGPFQFAQLLVLGKSSVYDGPCGNRSPSGSSFVNLVDPTFSQNAFGLKAAVTHGTPGVEYLVSASSLPAPNNNFVTLWKLTNPLAQSPTLSAVNVAVAPFAVAPGANQLGGSGGTPTCPAPCLIDPGDNRLLNAVFRGGSLWTAHTVAGGTGDGFARARYLKLDVVGNQALEDVSFGTDGCWYYYPSVNADVTGNLVMLFSRSCTDEFAGARYTGRRSSDPAGFLQPSSALKAGEANYVKTFGGSENRWGDYLGTAVDPADPQAIWMLGEYAASPANTWGTWIGAVRNAVPSTCVPSATTLCLQGGRFKVQVSWRDFVGNGGAAGVAAPRTSDSGMFYFYGPNNWEILVKVLNACGSNGNHRYWVFAAAATTLEFTMTVTDTQNGLVRVYSNPLGMEALTITDTNAFDTCP